MGFGLGDFKEMGRLIQEHMDFSFKVQVMEEVSRVLENTVKESQMKMKETLERMDQATAVPKK